MTKKISVAVDISGTIYNMIVIYGTLVDTLGVFFRFWKILILWVVKGGRVKGRKMVQNEKKMFFTFFPDFNFWGQ